MGSSSSRMGGRSSQSRPSSTKRLLSSLICGSSTSYTPGEMEECPTMSLSFIENLAPVSVELPSSRAELSSIFGSETGPTDSKTEVGTSSGICNGPIDDNFVRLKNVETSSSEKCLTENREVVSHQVHANCNGKEAYLEKNCDTAITPSEEQPCLESVLANERVNFNLTADAEAAYSANTAVPLICPEDRNSTSAAQEHHDGVFSENNRDAAMGFNTSPSGSLSIFSGSLLSLLLGDDTAPVARPPGSGFLGSDTENDLRGGSLLHVDVVSFSSNILSSSIAEISNREARRNSRRLFWDALSRRSFRRQSDSPMIVFATGHADDLGSHDRWFLDLSGDLHYDGVGRDFGYSGSRGHRRNERQWHLRSEVSERPHSNLDEGGRRTTTCASGLHPDGTCSCESFFMAEESSALASISRIVMLAEALFEVLPWLVELEMDVTDRKFKG